MVTGMVGFTSVSAFAQYGGPPTGGGSGGGGSSTPGTPTISFLMENPSWNQEFTASPHTFNYAGGYSYTITVAEVPITCKFTFGVTGGTPNTTVNLTLSGNRILGTNDISPYITTTSPTSYPVALNSAGNGNLNLITLSGNVYALAGSSMAGAKATASINGGGSVSSSTGLYYPGPNGPAIPSPNSYLTPFSVKNP